jgi:carbonic anhydrase
MRILGHLFARNKRWSADIQQRQPDFFQKLAEQQAPEYLWIGCSDSRVPANQVVDLMPGDLFVHRNVANLVVHTDLNCLAVIQYAVDVLEVRNIIVCGHYGCGGVLAALRGTRLGLIDNWLRHVQDVHQKHRLQLEALPDETQRHDRLCELNVIEQVVHLCGTTVVQDAWLRGKPLAIHGWIYGIRDGLLKDLQMCVEAQGELAACYDVATALKLPSSS